MSNEQKLLPCPLCGCDDLIVYDKVNAISGTGHYAICCPYCECELHNSYVLDDYIDGRNKGDSKDLIIHHTNKRWNTRAPTDTSQQQAERIKELEQQLRSKD